MDSPDANPDGPRHAKKSADPFDSAALGGMGIQFVAAILLCLFVGRWLDRRLGTTPWLMILGVFAGATAATISMYRRVFPPEGKGSSGGAK
ncbi:MAG TPA: AtpZ/AtpI family protein [Gemmatimonadaceae bacterium]|jgi:F0F1-type ATP synthase assembly protein I|nr:AtpZ/AtpI family protein [Gemmatimonadaceae bacterium]